jgi:hypothetical protein
MRADLAVATTIMSCWDSLSDVKSCSQMREADLDGRMGPGTSGVSALAQVSETPLDIDVTVI